MTNREAQIFQWIVENPMISQEELAAKAGIARSSAAVHISNLMKKGYILGKGYVTSGPSYCTVIGGANIDIGGVPDSELVDRDSNPGRTVLSLGGVGRNIAHNMRLLGLSVKLVTAMGGDVYAEQIAQSCEELGIELQDSIKISKENTSTYLYIADENGDMKLALSDMRIYEHLTPEYIQNKLALINRGRMVVIDTNIPAQTIEYICEKSKAPVFADPVSGKKAEKLFSVLDKLYAVTPNRHEAEVLSGVTITCDADLEKAAEAILQKGVKNVFITLGEKGVYCANEDERFLLAGSAAKVVSTTGAGDSFMAGLALGFTKRLGLKEMAQLGLAAAGITIESEQTINPLLSVSEVEMRSGIELL